MIDDFDVVAIGVEHEGAVIARVVRTFAGRSVVDAAGCDGGSVECVDGRGIAPIILTRVLIPLIETASGPVTM